MGIDHRHNPTPGVERAFLGVGIDQSPKVICRVRLSVDPDCLFLGHPHDLVVVALGVSQKPTLNFASDLASWTGWVHCDRGGFDPVSPLVPDVVMEGFVEAPEIGDLDPSGGDTELAGE